MRRLHVLCNPVAGAGRGLRALDGVRDALRDPAIELRVVRTTSAAHAAEEATAAARAGGEVVALGGDGMARIVAHAIRGSDATLGVLPGGRGNDLAAVLGLGRDPVAACAVLREGATRTIDVGEADDEHGARGATFLGVASIGMESEVTRLAARAPRIGGRATYAGAMVVGLIRWRSATFDLRADGVPVRHPGYIAAAANSGRFGGGMRIAPDAALDDGLLDLVVVEDLPKGRFLRLAPKVFLGTHVARPEVHVLRAAEVRMDADRPLEVFADGDPLARTPATIRVVPGAMRVLAPRRSPV